MELVGEQLIDASRPRVWAAINDPDILSRCIPGCEEINALSSTEHEARVILKIGPVRARFGGRILMSDIVEPSSCRLSFEGAGGAAGFAKGHSEVALLEEGSQTRLRYSVSASVGGKLGQIGGRLIDAAARKVADEFFTAFDAVLAVEARDADDASEAGNSDTSGVNPADGVATLSSAAGSAATTRPHASRLPTPSFAYGRPATEAAPWSWGTVLAGEASRVLWFFLGVGTTLLVTYFAR